VIVHDGRALFLFGGTKGAAQAFAAVMNGWYDAVVVPAQAARPGQAITFTAVVAPSGAHYYLPPWAQTRVHLEPDNLAAIREALRPEVRFADVLREMDGHKDEPLFFKSDHHWTGLGAYYAYRAWAASTSTSPLPLSAFTHQTARGAPGSYWQLLRQPALLKADPSSEYWVPPTTVLKTERFSSTGNTRAVPERLFDERARGYSVFLGGDHPLFVATTAAGTGRHVLVVKNSYGNAFAPYLVPHFDTVVVVDYRYVTRNIHEIMQTYAITDVVLVTSTAIADSPPHQKRLTAVARGARTAWLTPQEKRRLQKEQEAQAAAAADDSPVASQSTSQATSPSAQSATSSPPAPPAPAEKAAQGKSGGVSP
jgi:hypothetical protein